MGVAGAAKRARRSCSGWVARMVVVLLAAAISGCSSSDNKQASSSEGSP